MKRFACGDVVPGCEAAFLLATEEEILVAVAQHAAGAHDLAALPVEVLEQVRSRIVSD
jgi:predicted small metal-binding protein